MCARFFRESSDVCVARMMPLERTESSQKTTFVVTANDTTNTIGLCFRSCVRTPHFCRKETTHNTGMSAGLKRIQSHGYHALKQNKKRTGGTFRAKGQPLT